MMRHILNSVLANHIDCILNVEIINASIKQKLLYNEDSMYYYSFTGCTPD